MPGFRDMLGFVTTTLVSGALSAALLAILGWLLRTWLKERLVRGIEHEYAGKLEALRARNAEELERFRAELQKHQAVMTAATTSFLAARAAAHERTLGAVQQLWQSLLDIRATEPAIVGTTSFLLPDEIRAIRQNPRFAPLIAGL